MILNLDFKLMGVIRPINVLNVLCAQLTRDLFAIAKFLNFYVETSGHLQLL